jgi:hypothetical protein
VSSINGQFGCNTSHPSFLAPEWYTTAAALVRRQRQTLSQTRCGTRLILTSYVMKRSPPAVSREC